MELFEKTENSICLVICTVKLHVKLRSILLICATISVFMLCCKVFMSNNYDDDNDNNDETLASNYANSVVKLMSSFDYKSSWFKFIYSTVSLVPPLYNGRLAWYNAVLTSQFHSCVKYSQQSQLRSRATVE